MAMTPAEADKVLADNFAPWVLDLGLTVESLGDDRAVLRLPWSQGPAREGGGLSGQALMAAAGGPPGRAEWGGPRAGGAAAAPPAARQLQMVSDRLEVLTPPEVRAEVAAAATSVT
ncbi:hypothetical protein ACFWH6_07130, partial [Streptomyces griseorubiginosus]